MSRAIDYKMKEKTVEVVVKLGFTDKDKTKMSSDAVRLTSEVIKVYILEALERAAQQAKRQDTTEVTPEHFEKILPQFLLDFN